MSIKESFLMQWYVFAPDMINGEEYLWHDEIFVNSKRLLSKTKENEQHSL